MNVQPYVRHSKTCPKRADRYWKRCQCRKWLWISGGGKQRRVSAKTRSWERAEKMARQMMDGELPALESAGQNIAEAIKQYVRDKQSQNVTDGYVSHVERLLERNLLPWCQAEGVVHLDELTLARLESYRQTWESVNYGRQWRQGKIKEFLAYCVRHKWIPDNPAELLSPVRVRKVPTGYFTQEEIKRIVAAVPTVYARERYKGQPITQLAERLRTFILLLRWSGLRIGDAISLTRARLSADDKILLYMAKTGQPVFVPIPPDVAAALRKQPGEQYFFWSGAGSVTSAVKNWRYLIGRVLEKAGLKGHPHMFRDTFAVELLLAGVPIEQVSMLLGHSSTAITMTHYAPWVKARQVQLEESVRKAWG